MGFRVTDDEYARWVQSGLVDWKGPRMHDVISPTNEKEFMADLKRLAKSEGWRVYHTHDSRRSDSGFPDLVMLRERLIVAELKMPEGRLTAAQANWLDSFRSVGVPAYEWRPEQWPEIVNILRSRV